MIQRRTHLVGSMPFANEQDAMKRALDHLGTHLSSLPDGEIGEKTPQYPKGKRAAWVMTAIDICTADTENWEVAQDAQRGDDGFPVGYDTVQKLRPKHPPSAMYQHLDFGYHTYFKESYPLFKQLRDERGQPDLKFQVGVPTGLGITFAMMGKIDALRYASVFSQRIAYEVNEIIKLAGDDVVIQVEVPGELALAHKLPNFLIGIPLKSIYGLVRRIDSSAELGVHICLGDLNNEALIHPKTLKKLVYFSNQMVKTWPKSHQIAYVHYPLAEAASPPPTNEKYYADLKDIKLPEHVRFIAGFVHKKRSKEEHQHILQAIESVRGGTVDIACSCGMGRYSEETALSLLMVMKEMAEQK